MSEHRLDRIVIERPRSGFRLSSRRIKGQKKLLQQITEIASTDGLLSPYLIKTRGKTKYFSDHLGPMRRWLRSKVGQPWDIVYNELCQRIDTKTLCGQHLIFHVWQFVEREVYLIYGLPYHKHGYRYYGWRGEGLYVHPETGMLCKVERGKRQAPQKPSDRLILDEYHEYRKVNDLWFLVTFQDQPPEVEIQGIQPEQGYYWHRGYAISKRQCNKKEIKYIMKQLAKNL
ncbi:MAG TPA: hypothetical protein DCY88_06635 [Cyanobacteria bacterium UBA11372]|nr:hypothetical protein [Cyanobacteria bacterium UBA11372]